VNRVLDLPPDIPTRYRCADSSEIRSWSFGRVSRRRANDPSNWRNSRGTLDDQAIFGPTRDHQCACGKYSGLRYERMVCDVCGVKITRITERSTRFGHIELSASIPHPAAESARIQAFPVLPAAFLESAAGTPVAELYDELLAQAEAASPDPLAALIERICERLAPGFVEAARWNLSDSLILAHGMALERVSIDDEGCLACGYPLPSTAERCPGCGRPRGN
jgi:hypothetical protein